MPHGVAKTKMKLWNIKRHNNNKNKAKVRFIYVLSVTVQDTDPADLAALLKELQGGYIKVTLER